MKYTYYYESPLGTLVMVSDGMALQELDFGAVDVKHEAAAEKLPVFADICRWLDIYFGGQVPDFMPPLLLAGTPFRQTVWEILRTIPYGEIITYGEIAAQIARAKGVEKMSAQAVGGAVGHNPIAIIVPCHRVMGKDGSLTGYAGGLWRKEWLLNLERNCRKENHHGYAGTLCGLPHLSPL